MKILNFIKKNQEELLEKKENLNGTHKFDVIMHSRTDEMTSETNKKQANHLWTDD